MGASCTNILLFVAQTNPILSSFGRQERSQLYVRRLAERRWHNHSPTAFLVLENSPFPLDLGRLSCGYMCKQDLNSLRGSCEWIAPCITLLDNGKSGACRPIRRQGLWMRRFMQGSSFTIAPIASDVSSGAFHAFLAGQLGMWGGVMPGLCISKQTRHTKPLIRCQRSPPLW